ncbi:uncharacterized protein TRUGW13939_03961 [Talaromyces rugulosus]|uniref:PEBP-like protein n=1 Tax=Talaromyces rugulosus TaxID=121627 RepID=A0A7H8QS89_TALRU|nr:uncharacterized protein TRUGW13939_03961 [Talaromyces rugulosus]QKX56854.1 hypothetical protein TRUGW13939_03961 [Talaromyces rugulosus]
MEYVERIISWTLSARRGHDAGLISKTNPFTTVAEPTLALECPDIGDSGSKIPPKYSFFETGHFPTLKWPEAEPLGVKEWLLIVEDPDAPLAEPVTHGIYYSISASKTGVSYEDFEDLGDFNLKGGFKYGLNRRKTVYIAPRGLLGHGPHRYFFEIIGLSEPLDTAGLSSPATKEEVVSRIDGKVVAWGQWTGVWERT